MQPQAYAPQRNERPAWRRALGVLAALVLLVKFAAKAKALLLLPPKLKLFTTSASMLVSIGAYSLIWGWKFAIGFCAAAARARAGARDPAASRGHPPRRRCSSRSGCSGRDEGAAQGRRRRGARGPRRAVLGSLAALVPLALYGLTGDELFKALAFVGFFLNLFNLLPVLPLDGGRAMAALSPWMWLVGYALLIAAAIAFPNPIMILILLFGGLETWRRWKERNSPESREFHRVRPGTRAAIAMVYLGLAAALAVGMDATFLDRDFGDV